MPAVLTGGVVGRRIAGGSDSSFQRMNACAKEARGKSSNGLGFTMSRCRVGVIEDTNRVTQQRLRILNGALVGVACELPEPLSHGARLSKILQSLVRATCEGDAGVWQIAGEPSVSTATPVREQPATSPLKSA